jgi:AbrB family looped-hinge helix DNA binding protein
MRTTIDAAGRIVVPKPLRDELGFRAGQALELTARDGILEVAVTPTEVRLEKRGAGAVAVPEEVLPPLTADAVRATLERTRR